MTNSNNDPKGGDGGEPVVDKMDQPISNLIIVVITIYAGVVFGFCIFPLAGDWLWVEGWVFAVLFASFTLFTTLSLNKKNPRVLRNRMTFRKEKKMEKEESEKASESDKWFFPIVGISMILLFVISDLDHQFNWAGEFPIWLEVVGFVIIGVGLYITYLSAFQNAYASKVLDIREGQTLIDTGLYAHVRHPLYSGMLGLIVGIPIGLGSWWGLIPAVVCIFSLIVRIKYEEKMLITGLGGYKEYREKVKHKLIPKIY